MLLFLLFLGSERWKFGKWPTDNAQKMTLFRCWMSDEWVLSSSVPLVTSVEINKYKIFDANNAWITELQFQKPKKHNLSNLPHQTVEKLQKNRGVLQGPQLGKQHWRARLGILRVKLVSGTKFTTQLFYNVTIRACNQENCKENKTCYK